MDLKDLKTLEGLKILKKFGGGRQSKEVRLLEKNVVAKFYDPNNDKHVKGFHLEVENFKILKNCSFVPKIYAVDDKNMIIYMSYAGEKPKEWTKELKALVRDRLQTLKKQFKLTRKFLYKKWLPRLNNVAIDSNGSVNMIDFGPPWHIDNKAPVENKYIQCDCSKCSPKKKK